VIKGVEAVPLTAKCKDTERKYKASAVLIDRWQEAAAFNLSC